MTLICDIMAQKFVVCQLIFSWSTIFFVESLAVVFHVGLQCRHADITQRFKTDKVLTFTDHFIAM